MSAPAGGLGWFDAVVLGIVEGLTEFLPVSSTGHLIVAQRLLGLPADATNNVFAIGIQMGAITAILVLYWRRLWAAASCILTPQPGRTNLIWLLVIAALPAALLGLLLDDWIDAHLFSTRVVAGALVGGGLLLLLLERWLGARPPQVADLGELGWRTALGIGLFQCLALVPGTSRSGATIGGALLLGLSRATAAEFSFLVGLPILYGASGYKLLRATNQLDGELLAPFAIGTAVSFLSALAVVRPFVRFLRAHTFAPFAWYRIIAGIGIAAFCSSGHLE